MAIPLPSGSSSSTSSPSTSSSSTSDAPEDSSYEASDSLTAGSSGAPFEIFPARTLVSVASLTDLMVHPLSAPQGSLYRASTVALLFRSKSYMEEVLSSITADVKINAQLQRMTIDNIEVVELQDPIWGLGGDKDFYFR